MANVSSGISLVVSPQEMIKKSGEVSNAIVRMEAAYDLIKTMVYNTSQYWEGEAGNSFRNLFQDKQDEMETMLKRLKDHPSNLLKMAGLFTDNEGKLEEENTMLPTDPLE